MQTQTTSQLDAVRVETRAERAGFHPAFQTTTGAGLAGLVDFYAANHPAAAVWFRAVGADEWRRAR